jgi:hypothetical protein
VLLRLSRSGFGDEEKRRTFMVAEVLKLSRTYTSAYDPFALLSARYSS